MNTAPSRRAPIVALLLLAPLAAEVLPGALRLSALFAFPIVVAWWGGTALLVRAAARRFQLGWVGLLALALAVAVAEEFLVQQTSLAPLVIQIRGVEWARAGGVNYVYATWALLHEPVFAVLVPVALVEHAWPEHRHEPWIGRRGAALAGVAVAVGAALAWTVWTRVARTVAFHQPVYDPPPLALLAGLAAVVALVTLAFGRARALSARAMPRTPPGPWALAQLGALWAILVHGLVVLAFGILPELSPGAALAAGAALALAALGLVPGWAASPRFGPAERLGLAGGCLAGAMLAGFVAFIGAWWADLAFKVATNAIAVALLLRAALRLRRPRPCTAGARA